MLNKKLTELIQYKSKVAELEKEFLSERAAQLQRLHTDMGYATRKELIKALRAVADAPVKRGAKKKAAAPAKKAKRTRAKVTDELRAQIVEAVKGGATAAKAAKQFGVSVPTVQNIKKAAGMVKARGAAPADVPPAT
jgi:hypothetical protein